MNVEEIYYIYAGHNPEYSFIRRPFEYIIKEINLAIKQGKTTVIFSNISETLDIHIQKIQRVAEYFLGYDVKFIVTTGSIDGQLVYDEMYKRFDWKNRIEIRYTPMFELAAANQLQLLSDIEYKVEKKDKLFLSFNRRATLPRFYLLNFVIDNSLLDKSFFSFEGVDLKYFLNVVCTQCKEYKNTNTILEKVPIRLNITEDRSNPVDCRFEDKEYFDRSYFSVVTETYFSKKLDSYNYSYKFFSEKIFKPIVFKHPFIFMGWPGALQELKKLGYKTFSPYIDETYDTIEDDFQRYSMITKEILRLSKKTDIEWIQWQQDIKDIVEYNNTLLLSKWKTRHA